MNIHNFILVNADTDSISFSKSDESFIEKSERISLLNELNGLFPEKIKFENDGFYKTIICLMAKNYIMEKEDGSIVYKGSALKDSKKEPALYQFMKDIIGSILNNENNYLEIYNKYVKEIKDLKDIKRWASKKTITKKVLTGEGTAQKNILATIENTEYNEGDKIHVYFDEEDVLKLAENFDGKYSKTRLLQKLYKTSETFESIISMETFLNYSLKRNQKLLEVL